MRAYGHERRTLPCDCCNQIHSGVGRARARRQGLQEALESLVSDDLGHMAPGSAEERKGSRGDPGDPESKV